MATPAESVSVPVSVPVATRFPSRAEKFVGVKLPTKEPVPPAASVKVPVIGALGTAVVADGTAAWVFGAALAAVAPAVASPNAASNATTIIESRCRCVIVPPWFRFWSGVSADHGPCSASPSRCDLSVVHR
jgi:hypothetical protein